MNVTILNNLSQIFYTTSVGVTVADGINLTGFLPLSKMFGQKKQKKPGNFGVKQGKNHPNHSTLDLKR
jgi:hypothetical protein